MFGVPRLGCRGNEICSRSEGVDFVGAQIVGGDIGGGLDAAHSRKVVLAKYGDGGGPNRLAGFLGDLPVNHGSRRQTQSQVFGVETSACDNASPEILMLLVGVAEKAPPAALERILSGGELKLESAILAGHQCLADLGVLGVGHCNEDSGQGLGRLGVDYCSRNAVSALPFGSGCSPWSLSKKKRGGAERRDEHGASAKPKNLAFLHRFTRLSR